MYIAKKMNHSGLFWGTMNDIGAIKIRIYILSHLNAGITALL
jgi:hypothetical protein